MSQLQHDSSNSYNISSLDYTVGQQIAEIRTDVKWIKETIKTQQEIYNKQQNACINCKNEINKEFKNLNIFKARITIAILIIFLILAIIVGPQYITPLITVIGL